MLKPGTDSWKEAVELAIKIGSPIFDQLLREGLPITREEYIKRAWGVKPDPWDAECEAQMPIPLQDWSQVIRLGPPGGASHSKMGGRDVQAKDLIFVPALTG